MMEAGLGPKLKIPNEGQNVTPSVSFAVCFGAPARAYAQAGDASLASLEEGQGFLGSLCSPRKPKPTPRACASGRKAVLAKTAERQNFFLHCRNRLRRHVLGFQPEEISRGRPTPNAQTQRRRHRLSRCRWRGEGVGTLQKSARRRCGLRQPAG